MKARAAVVGAVLAVAAGGCNVSFENPGTGKDDGGAGGCVGCDSDGEAGETAAGDACTACDTYENATDATEAPDAFSVPDVGFDVAGHDAEAPFDAGGQCQSDFQCPDPRPYCWTFVGYCVGCYADSHCPGGVCDMIEYQCKPADDAGTDTGAETEPRDAGDVCDGYSCLCDSYCTFENGTPVCVTGCRHLADCCQGNECVNGTCVAKTCASDADCSGALPHCNTADGRCGECVYDSHCANGYFCDQFSHTCQITDQWCNPPCDPSSQYCDEANQTCLPKNADMCKLCAGSSDCVTSGLICSTFLRQCTKQCTLDADCMGYTCSPIGFCACP